MVEETTPTTQDKQVTVDIPEDRVAEFYAFYAHFLAGRRGRRGRGPGRHGHRHGQHGHGCSERTGEHREANAADEAQQA